MLLRRPSQAKFQRSRQVLFWAMVFFLGAQVTLSTILDGPGARVRFPYFYQQIDRAAELPRPPDIICLGSSRFGSGLEHREMTRILRARTGDANVVALNSYAPAGDLYVNERMLQGLLGKGIVPRMLLLELLPESVNHRNDWFRLHVARQLTWGELPKYAPEITVVGHLSRLLGARFLPAFHLRGDLREWLFCTFFPTVHDAKQAEIFTRPDMNHLPPENWESRIQESLAKLPTGPQPQTTTGVGDVVKALDQYHPGGTSAASLEAILLMCKQRGIQVFLVGAPVSSAHRACYSSEVEARFQSYLAQIDEKFGVPYLDFRDRLPDACFLDNHHPNNAGTFLLTRQLTLEHLVPAWRKIARTH